MFNHQKSQTMKKLILFTVCILTSQFMVGQASVQTESEAKKAEQKALKALSLLREVDKQHTDSLSSVTKSIEGTYTEDSWRSFAAIEKSCADFYSKVKLELWRKSNKTSEGKNKCPNCPLTVANNFIKACMSGEVSNSIKYSYKEGDNIQDEGTKNVLTGKLNLKELSLQAKTNPAGASSKLKETFSGMTLEPNPIVSYDPANENIAYVLALSKMNNKCCVNLKLEKISGMWKVVSMDDYMRKIKDQESLEKEMSSNFKSEFRHAVEKG